MLPINFAKTHKYSQIQTKLNLFVFAGFLCLCSCQIKNIEQLNPDSKIWVADLNDMLPRPMIRAILSDSLEASIPFQITDSKGTNLSNIPFEILKKENSVNLITNKSGIVTLNLNYALLTENPKIKISTDSTLAKDVRFSVGGKTVVFTDGKSIDNDVIDFVNLPFIENKGFKLYYTISKDSASNILPDFLETMESIKINMGMSEIGNISPLIVIKNNISIIGEPENVILLPITIDSWQEKYWYFTHETVENELINKNNLYTKNPNLRFIGDGLADLISFNVLKNINPNYAQLMLKNRLKSLEKDSPSEFDVNNWGIDSGDISGYSYSLAFWLKLQHKFTLTKIHDFMNSFVSAKQYSKEEVSKMFEKTFGNKISYKITKAEAIEQLSHLHQK